MWQKPREQAARWKQLTAINGGPATTTTTYLRVPPTMDKDETNELFRLIRKRKWDAALELVTHIDEKYDDNDKEEEEAEKEEEKEEKAIKQKNINILRHVDRNGMTALHWACFYALAPTKLIITLINKFNEAARIPDAESGQLPLHIAVSTPVSSLVVCRLLEVHPRGVLVKDKDGCCPIELAQRRRESKNSFQALLIVAMEVGGPQLVGRGTPPGDNNDGGCRSADKTKMDVNENVLQKTTAATKNNQETDKVTDQQSDNSNNNNNRKNILHWGCSYYIPRQLLRQTIEKYGPNILMQQDEHGQTPLHVAAHHAPKEIIAILVEKCPPTALSLLDHNGQTPLAIACDYKRCIESIESLLLVGDAQEKKKIAEIVDNDGNTPLHLLFHRNLRKGIRDTEQIARLLLDVYPGATSIRTKKEGTTPLFLACAKNMPTKIIAMILEADPSQANVATNQSHGSETPLFCATRLKSIGVIKLLLKESPETSERWNALGLTCLQDAFLKDSSSDTTKVLLGASPHQVSIAHGLYDKSLISGGNNMLHFACCKESDDVVKMLASSCPKAASCQNDDGATPLLLSVVKKRSMQVIKALVEADPSQIKVSDKKGTSPLKILCRRTTICMDSLSLMTSACPDAVTAVDKEGRTPLWWLLKKGTIHSLPATRLLIKVNSSHIALGDKEGTTPLHRAAAHGWGEVGHLVRACPEACSVKDKNGRTPLHLACMHNGPFSVLNDLVDVDMDQMSVPDNDGFTPAKIFYQNHHGYVCNYVAHNHGMPEPRMQSHQKQTLRCESSYVRDFCSRLNLVLGAEQSMYGQSKGVWMMNASLKSATCPSDFFDFLMMMVHPSWLYEEDMFGDLPIHAACSAPMVNYERFYKCVKCKACSKGSPLFLLHPKDCNFYIPESRVYCKDCYSKGDDDVVFELSKDNKIQKIVDLVPGSACFPNAHGRLPLFVALEAGLFWDEHLKEIIYDNSPHLYIQSRDSKTHLYPFMLAAVGANKGNSTICLENNKSNESHGSEENKNKKEESAQKDKASIGKNTKQLESVFSLLLVDPTLVGCGV